MGIVTQILGLILSLSILVLLHELGHFTFSKIFKTRVEKFYLFFNPWFSIFKVKRGETEYGLGWLPLGGYVKISGMIDESMDKEQLNKEPQPWEFRSKPTWQRLLIMIGGVLVNFILALFIYAMILFTWGKEYMPAENAKYGVVCDSLALNIGLQDGDKVLLVDTFKIKSFNDITNYIITEEGDSITVDRNGEVMSFNIPDDFDQQMLKKEVSSIVQPRYPFVIDSVIAGNPADSAGILYEDKIIGIKNGLRIIDTAKINDSIYAAIIAQQTLQEKINSLYKYTYTEDLQTPYYHLYLENIGKYRNQDVELIVDRNNEIINIPIRIGGNALIGVLARHPLELFGTKKIKYGFLESFPAGINLGVERLVGYVKNMRLVFTKEGAKQVGGFGAIGGLFPKAWNWKRFWDMTAFLSIILAFMNILPIPALDGGHVMFLLYEMVTRRKPNEKFMEYAQIAGMIILFSLLIFANGNDIFKAFF